MKFWEEPLTHEQTRYISDLIRADNVDEVRKLLQDGIKNEKDPSGGKIHLDEYTLTVPIWRDRNMLQDAACKSAMKCVELLINAPYSWNVDMPDGDELTAMYLAECDDNPGIAIKMAPLSKQMRPYPAEFTVINGTDFLQYICTALLWPQLALIDQPWRMKSHLEEITKNTIYTIEERHNQSRLRTGLWRYNYVNFGFMCELLLANAELVNADLTGDGRLPYDDVTRVDSSRMWPITPISKEFVDEHNHCNNYPQCMNEQPPEVAMNIWKIHRFGHTLSHPEALKFNKYALIPPTLREFSRLIIRRNMVRHVEPLNGNTEVTMFPNQTILLRYLSLPRQLMEYMLFTDIPTSPYSAPSTGHAYPGLRSYRETIPTYGRGTLLKGGFIPNSFNTLFP